LAKRPYCVGFAAESEKPAGIRRGQTPEKNIPLLVGNIGHQTFGQDQNELGVVRRSGPHAVALADKQTLARRLVGEIARRL